MTKRARLLLGVGLVLLLVGLAAGLYYFNRLSDYIPRNCEFCPGRPVPGDLRLLGYVSSIVAAIGGALSSGVLASQFVMRRRKPRQESVAPP
jgi:hypothetical protein